MCRLNVMRKNLKYVLTSILVVALLASLGLGLSGCVKFGADADATGVLEDKTLLAAGDDPLTYEITFIFNGGVVPGSSDTRMTISVYTLYANQVPSLTRSNYTFAGWFFNSDLSGSRLTMPYTFSKNTTLYAKWIASGAVKISTAEELMALNNKDRAGLYTELSGSYYLANDIDLSAIDEWTPIGDRLNPFSGTFDGNGYAVRSMKITKLKSDEEFNYLPIGLFAVVTGTVKNLSVLNYSIQLPGDCSRFYIGGICGQVGLIDNVTFEVLGSGTLTNCYAAGTIFNPSLEYTRKFVDTFIGSSAKPTERVYLGGAVGMFRAGTVSGIATEGSIISETNEDEVYAGGAVGYVDRRANLTTSSSSASVFCRYAGGLAGFNNGTVTRCFANGTAEGSLAYPAIAGGLVSYNFSQGSISRSYATGNVKARTAGGLVGVNIFDYAAKDDNGVARALGGLIRNCYASGAINATEYGGGLIGRAVSDIPILGRKSYHTEIYDGIMDFSDSGAITYTAIDHCFAYGDVTVDATEIVYVDSEGNTSTTKIYYPVYAGGLIGQANELLIGSCIAFGDVSALSLRPTITGENYNYNPAYANNLVGHSSNLLSTQHQIYALSSVSVYRNGYLFLGDYNSVPTLTAAQIDAITILTSDANMGFENTIWSFTGINIAQGIYPVLII